MKFSDFQNDPWILDKEKRMNEVSVLITETLLLIQEGKKDSDEVAGILKEYYAEAIQILKDTKYKLGAMEFESEKDKKTKMTAMFVYNSAILEYQSIYDELIDK